MSVLNFTELLKLAILAAEKATEEILDVYNSSSFQIETKDDFSPLTIADKRSHQAIESILQQTGIPILSEEGKHIPYETRRQWERFWMIDPLDGTKEFIKRNGEFTVNVALIDRHIPVLGVVGIPVTGELYYAAENRGVFLKTHGKETLLPNRKPIALSERGLRVVASRSHLDEQTQAFVSKLDAPELVSAGSSLKFMLLVSGKADIYPRFAPTMEWDTAAAHAIVNEAGLSVMRTDVEQPLTYNKENLLNPYFVCR